MNRATRDKLVSGTDQADLTAGNATWETPPEVYEKLNADFGPFDVDLTADATRALCDVWLGPGSLHASDALTAPWAEYGTNGYSNPPYGAFIPKVLRKARQEAERGFQTTFLLPMRANASFRNNILTGAAALLFCDKRIAFYENGRPRINSLTGKPDGAVFDSIVVRYLPGIYVPSVGVWEVPKHGKAEGVALARLSTDDASPKNGVPAWGYWPA